MKEYTYDLTAQEAIAIANICGSVKGKGGLKLLTAKTVKDILTVWPEFDPSVERDEPFTPEEKKTLSKLKRTLTIKTKNLRALAVGLVDIINDSKTTVGDVNACLQRAKDLRVANWVEKQIDTDKIEDFNEEMDGEEALVDPPE